MLDQRAACECGKAGHEDANVSELVGEFTRIIRMIPGYICPVEGGQSHGKTGVDMLFLLKKEKRAVQFQIMSGWIPALETDGFVLPSKYGGIGPLPADLGYHSPEPLYDGQEVIHSDCSWTDGLCYYDGSGLNAQKPWIVFTNDGLSALWKYLEDYWHSTFGATQ